MGIRRIICAMLALFAFGALFAATASAEETLEAIWLVKGTPVAELLSIEFSITLRLEDTKTVAGAAAVLCTGIEVG